jgi:hypothetical protein
MKLTTGIGINELGSMLPVVAGGGSSWDAGLLKDATFSNNSSGNGFAVWDKNAGTLTVYGENSSSHRGVANFELVGLNDGGDLPSEHGR